MTEPTKSEPEREQEFDELIHESEAIKSEVDSVLADVSRRLDLLSEELRRRGAFPVASQIDRQRPRKETAIHGR